jgi:hypothetical protein
MLDHYWVLTRNLPDLRKSNHRPPQLPARHRGVPLTRWVFSLSLILAVGLAGGCRNSINWGPPGTIGQQRARAHVYDPYPNNDLAPPIVSGRPPGYDRPTSEVRRLQQDNPYARKRAPVSPPMMPPPLPYGY